MIEGTTNGEYETSPYHQPVTTKSEAPSSKSVENSTDSGKTSIASDESPTKAKLKPKEKKSKRLKGNKYFNHLYNTGRKDFTGKVNS